MDFFCVLGILFIVLLIGGFVFGMAVLISAVVELYKWKGPTTELIWEHRNDARRWYNEVRDSIEELKGEQKKRSQREDQGMAAVSDTDSDT